MAGTDLLKPIAERAKIVRAQVFPATTGSSLDTLKTMAQAIDRAFQKSTYHLVPQELRRAWGAATVGLSPVEESRWAASLLADFIARSPERALEFPAPESVLPQTAIQFSRILDDIDKRPEKTGNLDSDWFLKDLSMSRMASFACVAQIVERHSGVGRSVVARELGRAFWPLLTTGFRSGFRYAPFLEIHTHTPMLGGFTPDGWDQCYLLVADLLVQFPDHRGLVGGSWFYDPELDRISPRLAYLRSVPVGGGAFLIRVGSTKTDVANATATSDSRRKLYEAGEYLPTSWLMIWPRDALLTWAREKRAKDG